MKQQIELLADCPSCAAKAERAIQTIDGIMTCSVNFLMGTCTIEYEGDWPKLAKQIKKVVKKVDRDIEVKA